MSLDELFQSGDQAVKRSALFRTGRVCVFPPLALAPRFETGCELVCSGKVEFAAAADQLGWAVREERWNENKTRKQNVRNGAEVRESRISSDKDR